MHHFLLTPGRHPPPAWALGDRWGGGHQLSPASLPLSAGMKAPGKKTGLKPHLTVMSALGRPCPQEAGETQFPQCKCYFKGSATH